MVDILEQIGNTIDNSFSTARGVVRGSAGNPPGFTNLANIASPSGTEVRQAKIANERDGTATRNLVRWFLPETGIVEMYINPHDIKYTYKKSISAPVRTRGGFSIQYWGEDLGSISINGTTGSSGVEGINVLEDIYRNEQVSMDPIALAAEAARDQGSGSEGSLLSEVGDLLGLGSDNLLSQVNNVIESGSVDPMLPKPTLASIAFQTEMYWSGWVFRGYFTSMMITESADKIGLFDYSLEFMVTQKRGLRLNFMPWHRSAVNGPSNSDPAFGVPYSFGILKNNSPSNTIDNQALSRLQRLSTSIDQALKSYRPE